MKKKIITLCVFLAFTSVFFFQFACTSNKAKTKTSTTEDLTLTSENPSPTKNSENIPTTPSTKAFELSTKAILGEDKKSSTLALERKDHLAIAYSDELLFINPLYSTHDAEVDISRLLFEPLIRFDKNQQPLGVLANDWTFDQEHKKISFTLNLDHTFSDGTAVTADDIIFTYQCLLSPSYDGGLRGHLTGLNSVEKNDQATISFYIADWIEEINFSWFNCGILSQAYYETFTTDKVYEMHKEKKEPLGSGPYLISTQDDNQEEITLSLREDHPLSSTLNFKNIQFKKIDPADKFSALQAETFDILRLKWDQRTLLRADKLKAYNFFPNENLPSYYLYIGEPKDENSAIQNETIKLALFKLSKKIALNETEKELLQETKPSLNLIYFQDFADPSAHPNNFNLDIFSELTKKLGLTITPKEETLDTLISTLLSKDFELLLCPAPLNNRLPDDTFSFDDPSIKTSLQTDAALPNLLPQINAVPVAHQDSVVVVHTRLKDLNYSQENFSLIVTINSNWTDSILTTATYIS